MVPTDEQIQVAAYHRWQRRGQVHGHHAHDWLIAEQDLRFALNYRIASHYPNIDDSSRPALILGDVDRPICRFCEQAAPRTRFQTPRPALPASLAVPGPLAADQCEECREQFQAMLDGPLAQFVAAIRAGVPPETVPPAVYKALVRSAFAFLPADLLDLFPDALDWIANPDDDPVDAAIAKQGVWLHSLEYRQHPWSAVAVTLMDSDEAMPHVLAFFGTDAATIELPLPLCLRDEDLDGMEITTPRVPTLDGLTRDPGPRHTRRLAVSREAPRRRSRMMSLDLP